MPLFPKTVRGECKFCQQLALECTKLKVGIFWEIDALDSYPVRFQCCYLVFGVRWRKTQVNLSMLHNFQPFTCSSNNYCLTFLSKMKTRRVGGSVVLVLHNFSIIPSFEQKFEHNTLVSRVTHLKFLGNKKKNLANPNYDMSIKKCLEDESKVSITLNIEYEAMSCYTWRKCSVWCTPQGFQNMTGNLNQFNDLL